MTFAVAAIQTIAAVALFLGVLGYMAITGNDPPWRPKP